MTPIIPALNIGKESMVVINVQPVNSLDQKSANVNERVASAAGPTMA